jgi:anti-anti-sigma factor
MAENLFRVSKDGAVNIVELVLPQQLDSEEFDRLNESLLEVLTPHPEANWVLDLSGLSYMGSAALGLMVNIRQRIKQAGGKLALCGMSPRLLRIFETCCLEKLFTIKATRADAVKTVGR